MSAELPPTVIDRPRLVARLDEGVHHRLTLVVGPSGSGKSVLLRQWAAGRPEGSLAWVRVDHTCADAVSFARQLVGAIDGVHPGTGAEALRHLELGGARTGTPFLDALVDELAGLPPTVVVLEDLHELPTGLVQELDRVVRRAPASLRVVIASRTRPELSLGRLRVQGQLTEVLAEELALRASEADELVRRVAGLRLTAGQLARVQARTEGWVVGVQLAAMALRDGDDVDAQLRDFGGAGRAVADYLADEVVAGQPPEVQSFLLRTCVLDRMGAALCDALTERSDSQQMLDELERRNLFITDLDGRREWYRYHPLFAEMLRFQLRGRDAALHDELLVRAARWHLDRGELSPGVELLLRAQRWEEALDLIGLNGWSLFERGEAATAIRWLEEVPEAVRWEHGQAPLTLASLHQSVGNIATAIALLDEIARRSEPGSFAAICVHVMRAGAIGWGRSPEECLADARIALAWLEDPPGHDERRASEPRNDWAIGPARLAGGVALLHQGRLAEARAWLSQAPGIAGEYPQWKIRTLGATALLEVEEGHLDHALAAGTHALRLAEEIHPLDQTAPAEAYLALGRATYERDRLDEAEALLAEGEIRSRANRSAVIVADIVVEQARIALARGAPRQGLDLLARWRREGEPPPPADVLARAAAVEVQMLLALDEVARAKRVLARAPRAAETLAAAAQLATAEGDDRLLDDVLRRWPGSTTVRGAIQHHLWQGVARDRAGDRAAATEAVVAALALAEADGHRRTLLDAGPPVVELLRATLGRLASRSAPRRTLAVLDDLVAASGPPPGTPGADDDTGLSQRELDVLARLGSHRTVVQIAGDLGISPNTLKTHLKRIYRKLGATSRRGALRAAEERGLLGEEP